jgi:hypothetical protein
MSRANGGHKVTKKSDMSTLKGPKRDIKSFTQKEGSKTRKYAHLSCGHRRTCNKTVTAEAHLRCRRCRPGAKPKAKGGHK